MGPPTELRVAWLLLLLSDELGHGYELNRAPPLRALGLEVATTYRTLRKMEADGLVESSWLPSHGAPPRRVYAITAAGRAALGRFAAEVEDIRDAHDAFLAAYRQALDATPVNVSAP